MKDFLVLLPLILSMCAMMSGLALAIMFSFLGLSEEQTQKFMISLGVAWMPSLVALSAMGPWILFNLFKAIRAAGMA